MPPCWPHEIMKFFNASLICPFPAYRFCLSMTNKNPIMRHQTIVCHPFVKKSLPWIQEITSKALIRLEFEKSASYLRKKRMSE